MVVRVRFTIDRASPIHEQTALPSSDTSTPASNGFTVDLEFRTYLGPLLVQVKRMPRGYLPNAVYNGLQQTLQGQQPDGSLPKLFGKLATNPGDQLRRELDQRLSAHQQCLAEVLWGDATWGEELANRVKQKLQHLANKGLYLELVLHHEMYQYMWEALHFEQDITGNLSITRMRVEDVKQSKLSGFCLSKKKAHLLTIIANPDNRSMADLSGLAQDIRGILSEVIFLKHRSRVRYRTPTQPITIKSTSEQISEFYSGKAKKFNIWFLIVHGSANSGGLLYYEGSLGQPKQIRLVDLFTQARGRLPEVCVLFACDIAGFGSQFVNGLLKRDVKLVVAMQAPISFEAAGMFAQFWKELDDFRYISLGTLERAVKRARTKMSDDNSHERIIPVLYARSRYGWSDWVRWLYMAALVFLTVVLMWRLAASWLTPSTPTPPTLPLETTPAITLTLTAPPTVLMTTITFTITCSNGQLYTVQAGKGITLPDSKVVFIEPNLIPKDGQASRGTLRKVSGEEKKFSYAPGGSGPDMVTFTFANEKAGLDVTKALPVTVVSEQRGLCYP